MNVEKLIKEGRKFTYNDKEVEIINENFFTGTANVIFGRAKADKEIYWFFNKAGERVDINGKSHVIQYGKLTVVKEEKEGWFAMVYLPQDRLPLVVGLYDTKHKCEQEIIELYPNRTATVHKIIFED